MHILLIIVLCIGSFLDAQEVFTDNELQFIQENAHPKAYEKLQKAMTFDADGYYRTKCVAQNKLVREHVSEKACAKADKARHELLNMLPTAFQNQIRNLLSSVIRGNTEYVVKSSDNAQDKALCVQVVKAIDDARALLDVSKAIKVHTSNDKTFPMFLDFSEDGSGFIYDLFFTPAWISSDPQVLKGVIAHELTHIKFGDFTLKEPSEEIIAKKHHENVYFQEDRADKYAAAYSIDIAKSLACLFTKCIRDEFFFPPHALNYNHPIKGQRNYDVHPSHLMRYANMLKIIKLHEAQKRWFGTAEADAKYGNAAYEMAFAKVHENKESIKRWKNIQLNSF